MITKFEFLATWLRARFDEERGASLVEYALLVALIAVVCIGALVYFGGTGQNSIQNSKNSIINAG